MATTVARPKLTEEAVIRLVAESLDISPSKLNRTSESSEFEGWDSMGLLGVISMLDREGVQFDIGDVESLQTMGGILNAFQVAGRL